MDFKNLKYLVIGAGFFGSVIAERIASDMDERVVVIERRSHAGGNCYSSEDKETGILYHEYGTHIFHTSNRKVWDYINRFTEFNGYFHQVLVSYKGKVYQMPINLETINSFYNVTLRPFEVDEFLKKEIAKTKIGKQKNLENKALSLVGRPLYEAFIKGYNKKQWRKDPKLLPESILTRLPFRKNYNESYYFSRWQGIPLMGYTEIFNKMLKHKNIKLLFNTDYFDIKDRIPGSTLVIYSGPIDKYFNYRFGRLEWRTLRFVKEVVGVGDFQGTSVMNYSDEDIPYTRIHEPRHLHTERNYGDKRTLIIKEYPSLDDGNNPYYPVIDDKNQKIFLKYHDEAKRLQNVIIGGRLGEYKYYDMHHTIDVALQTYEGKIKEKRSGTRGRS
jgi:UDP-galactopyranose mutase